MSLTLNAGGMYLQCHSALPRIGAEPTRHDTWVHFKRQHAHLGMEFLRDEKRQALELAERNLAELQEAREALRSDDYAQLVDQFERVILIIRCFAAVYEGYHQILESQAASNPAQSVAVAGRLRELAEEAARRYGEAFFLKTVLVLRQVADLVEAEQEPISLV